MRNLCILFLIFYISSGCSNLSTDVRLEEGYRLLDSTGYCGVEYNTYKKSSERFKTPITEVFWTCDDGMGSVVWRGVGADYKIKLEWNDKDELKIYHPKEIIILHQLSSLGELNVFYDPPMDNRKTNEPLELTEHEWPTTCDNAVFHIIENLDKTSMDTLRKIEKTDLIRFHHGWGTGIRNTYGLWRGNKHLIDSCLLYSPDSQRHPDTVSSIIMGLVWESLQSKEP